VGGGQGGLLAEILKAHPAVRGTLYDRAEVVQETAYLTDAGLIDRCGIVGGDFLSPCRQEEMRTSSSGFSMIGVTSGACKFCAPVATR
jgi:hypothetical protein